MTKRKKYSYMITIYGGCTILLSLNGLISNKHTLFIGVFSFIIKPSQFD